MTKDEPTSTSSEVEAEDAGRSGRMAATLRSLPSLFSFAGEDAIKVEEFQEDGTAVIRAEVPGVDPDRDIQVTVHNGVLRIHAERSESSSSQDKDHYRSEFRYGSFTRSLHLPPGATDADVKASYRDGILEVRVPIDREAATTRSVPITRS